MNSTFTFIRLGVRNLFRHSRRSLITIAMIGSGIAGLMFLRGFADGSYSQAIENFTSIASGHLQIYRKGFRSTTNVELPIEDIEAVKKIIRSRAEVKGLSERIMSQALISTAINAQGIMLVGISPEEELRVTRINQFVSAGSFFGRDDNQSILVGRQLAQTLKAAIGDKVVIFVQAYHGSMEAATYRIKGFIETGGKDIDARAAFITLEAARMLLGYSAEEASCVVVRLENTKEVPKIIQWLKPFLEQNGYEASSWDEIGPEMKEWIAFFDAIIEVIMIVVLLVVAVGIMNTIFMGVFERTHEFGLMVALGTRRSQLMLVVISEAAILSLLGICFGIILGLACIKYFHHVGINLTWYGQIRSQFYLSPRVFPVASAKFLLKAIIFLSIDSLLVSFYPAWKAASMEPIEAMRHI
jgi:ABC-type lipoprotein release transport system permease subunit